MVGYTAKKLKTFFPNGEYMNGNVAISPIVQGKMLPDLGADNRLNGRLALLPYAICPVKNSDAPRRGPLSD
ncbi:hypothetical protein [Sodalis praecaptivus]|uniref:hypothetical protein n=1 Tax=Sodalis praecaptivus TaxID=1239307 RepID=UPI00280ACEFD|nr:hypothetical protein [Sodalis praecaptivus]